jgi:hypothetical protein
MPMTPSGIADLLKASGKPIQVTYTIQSTLKSLHSVISSSDANTVITIFHASFPDFLVDTTRCNAIPVISITESHLNLARWCLQLMNQCLIQNIMKSDRRQAGGSVMTDKNANGLIYACTFWGSHIEGDDSVLSLTKELEMFLDHHILQWLEVLSLLGRLEMSIEVLQRLMDYQSVSS